MKKLFAALVLLLVSVGSSFAHEQKLQYPRTASVIGMQFLTNPDGTLSVQGNVKYYTQPSGCRYVCPKTYYNFVGTWDALGNLISQTVGSLPAQAVLYVNGNEQAYAQATAPTGPSTTGFDSRGYGYVDIPASH